LDNEQNPAYVLLSLNLLVTINKCI